MPEIFMIRRNNQGMRLESFARDFSSQSFEEDKSIDFDAAGLYVPAAQTIFATVFSSCVSIFSCWLIPVGAISAVRTLALTALSGILVMRKPIKIGQTRGVNTIFSALRPCCVLYVFCLVLEQLIHTCISTESTYEHGFWRRMLYHANMLIMMVAGFLRAKKPRSESDLAFLIAAGSVFLIAVLPPPALALSGPLCSPPTLWNAGERILRSFLFSCVYVVLVYSAAPISNNLPDTLICIARSATASAWVLGAVSYMLPLAIIQITLIVFSSFRSTTQYNAVPAQLNGDIECLVEDDANKVSQTSSHGTLQEHYMLNSTQEHQSLSLPSDDPDVTNALAIFKGSRPSAPNSLNFKLTVPPTYGSGAIGEFRAQ